MTAGFCILITAIIIAIVAYLSRPPEVVPCYFVQCAGWCGNSVMLHHKRQWCEVNYCAQCWKVLDDARNADRYMLL